MVALEEESPLSDLEAEIKALEEEAKEIRCHITLNVAQRDVLSSAHTHLVLPLDTSGLI